MTIKDKLEKINTTPSSIFCKIQRTFEIFDEYFNTNKNVTFDKKIQNLENELSKLNRSSNKDDRSEIFSDIIFLLCEIANAEDIEIDDISKVALSIGKTNFDKEINELKTTTNTENQSKAIYNIIYLLKNMMDELNIKIENLLVEELNEIQNSLCYLGIKIEEKFESDFKIDYKEEYKKMMNKAHLEHEAEKEKFRKKYKIYKNIF